MRQELSSGWLLICVGIRLVYYGFTTGLFLPRPTHSLPLSPLSLYFSPYSHLPFILPFSRFRHRVPESLQFACSNGKLSWMTASRWRIRQTDRTHSNGSSREWTVARSHLALLGQLAASQTIALSTCRCGPCPPTVGYLSPYSIRRKRTQEAESKPLPRRRSPPQTPMVSAARGSPDRATLGSSVCASCAPSSVDEVNVD